MGEENLATLRIGAFYARTALHDLGLGGERQRGISYPMLGSHALLFSHAPNEEFGYQDGWVDAAQGIYRFSGMWFGNGPMTLTRGNLAIVDRSPNLHLFVRSGTKYRYEGPFECVDYENVTGRNPWHGVAESALVFVLRRSSDAFTSAKVVEHSKRTVVRMPVKTGEVSGVRPDAFAEAEADPEMRRVLLEKAFGGHRQLVRRLSRAFEGSASCSEDPRSYDLLVEWTDGVALLIEVKTLPPWTLGRVRSAVGQVLEYEYRLGQDLGVLAPMLALATDRRVTPGWLFDYLVASRKFTLLYDDGGTLNVSGPHAAELHKRAKNIRLR